MATICPQTTDSDHHPCSGYTVTNNRVISLPRPSDSGNHVIRLTPDGNKSLLMWARITSTLREWLLKWSWHLLRQTRQRNKRLAAGMVQPPNVYLSSSSIFFFMFYRLFCLLLFLLFLFVFCFVLKVQFRHYRWKGFDTKTQSGLKFKKMYNMHWFHSEPRLIQD